MLSIYVVKPCVSLLAGLCLHFADAWPVEQPGPSTWFVWQQISDHACMHGRPYGRPYGRVMNSAQCGLEGSQPPVVFTNQLQCFVVPEELVAYSV